MNEAQRRAERAKEIIEDPIFIAAWNAAEAAALEEMINLPIGMVDQLYIHQARVKAVRDMRQELMTIITNGRAASLRQQRA